MSRFSSPEEYMEKFAVHPAAAFAAQQAARGGADVTGKFGPIASSLKGFGTWWKSLGTAGKVGVGAGALGLGALSALGVGQVMGGDRPGDTMSYKINRGMHGLLDRIRADEQVGEAFAKGIGSASAESLMGLTKDIMSKGYDSMKDTLMLSPVRQKIFSVLRKEDDVINMADNNTLMEAYHTMANVAPNLSTDKNAVKSVLRMAATSGGGLDFVTIKGIADAEMSVAKAMNERKKGGAL